MVPQNEESTPHYLSQFMAVISAFLWLAAVAIGMLADADSTCITRLRFAIFRNKTQAVYNSWTTDITPIKWTLGIWEFIYTWNMLWVVYCIGTMCTPANRKFRKNFASCNNIFPASLHLSWCVYSLTHIGWLLLWDREAFVASLFVQGFMISGCIICLVVSHKRIERCGALLQYQRPWDLWVARTLVQNGIMIVGTWNCFLFGINVVILCIYKANWPIHLSSAVVLSVFCILVLLWFIIEIACFDTWLRYSFSFYPTVAWIAIGILFQNFRMWSPVTIISLVLLSVSFMAQIIRVPLVVWRSFTNPLYIEQTIPHKVDTSSVERERITTVL